MSPDDVRDLIRTGTRDGRDRDFYAHLDEDDDIIVDGEPLRYWAIRSAGEWGSGEIARVHQPAHVQLLAHALRLAEMVLDLDDRLRQTTEERDSLRRTFCPTLFEVEEPA